MTNPKVSVIVCFYNVADYVDRALASLAEQSVLELEVIIIDDGSSDDTWQRIVPWVEQYNHFMSYKQENRGLGAARNFGLQKAHGEYVAFFDGDDYVAPDMYAKLLAAATAEHSDVVVCGYTEIFDNYTQEYSDGKALRTIFDIQPYAWNKLYRKQLFADLQYPELMLYEDIPTTYPLLARASQITVMSDILYFYDRRRKASIQYVHDDRIYELNKSLQLLLQRMEHIGLAERYSDELEYLFVFQLLFLMTPRICRNSGIHIWRVPKRLKRQQEVVAGDFPHWPENRYLIEDQSQILTDRLGKGYLTILKLLGTNLWWWALLRIVGRELTFWLR